MYLFLSDLVMSSSQNAFLFHFFLSFLISLVKMLCSLLVWMVWHPGPDRLCLCRVCVRAQAGLSSFLCSGTARRLVVRSEIMSRSCGVTRADTRLCTWSLSFMHVHQLCCSSLVNAAHFLFLIDFLTKEPILIGHTYMTYINLHSTARRRHC